MAQRVIRFTYPIVMVLIRRQLKSSSRYYSATRLLCERPYPSFLMESVSTGKKIISDIFCNCIRQVDVVVILMSIPALEAMQNAAVEDNNFLLEVELALQQLNNPKVEVMGLVILENGKLNSDFRPFFKETLTKGTGLPVNFPYDKVPFQKWSTAKSVGELLQKFGVPDNKKHIRGSESQPDKCITLKAFADEILQKCPSSKLPCVHAMHCSVSIVKRDNLFF